MDELAQKPQRSYLVGFTAATVILVIVSSVSVTYYYSSSADLLTKDREILQLQALSLSMNATVLEEQIQIYRLNANITMLNQQIAGLTQSQGVSNQEITSLVNQVLKLENLSAFLILELSVVARTAGNLSVSAYFVNDTVAVAPSTIMEVTTQTTGRNGTLAFISPNGCASPGNSIGSSYPTFQYYITLDSGSTNYVKSSFAKVYAPTFSFYLQNVGQSAVTCTFSLFYVGT